MYAIVISLFVIIFPLPTLSRSLSLLSNMTAAFQSDPEAQRIPVASFCNTRRLDAAFKGPGGKQYYFRIHEVFIVDKNTVRFSHRKQMFPNSPYFVDGMAYSPKTERAYLYKSRQIWVYKYDGNRFNFLMTKKLDRSNPNIIDAAFFYEGFIYLLKGQYVYAWDEVNNRVKPNHVFSIHYLWKDVPSNIAAVMQYGDMTKTVFWKWQPGTNRNYYIFDNELKKMVKCGSFVSFFPFCENEMNDLKKMH